MSDALGRPRPVRRWSMIAAVACCAGALACSGGEADRRQAALSSLIEAERAFSAAAAELGVLDAFRAYLAEDAVLFRPRLVSAQEWLAAQAPTPGLLAWDPVFADVSHAADLGFTTGPWRFSAEPESEPLAFGQYFSVWKQQADGAWKVVIDHGTSNPAPDGPLPALRFAEVEPGSPWVSPHADPAAERESLLETDRAFASAAEASGLLRALPAHVAADVWALRDGRAPLIGIVEVRADAARLDGRLSWTPLGGGVARSADLGYTYGGYLFTPAEPERAVEPGNYLRAWRRQPGGAWRVVVDLMSAIPQAAD